MNSVVCTGTVHTGSELYKDLWCGFAGYDAV